MPHAVFDLGSQAATADLAARQLVPGIEPGAGPRRGKSPKQALVLQDVFVQLNDLVSSGPGEGYSGYNVFLKLSQEPDLTPGLLLLVAHTSGPITAAADTFRTNILNPQFRAHGTIWVPRFVGVRLEEIGAGLSIDVDVHLDYDVVDVDWMDWFLMWEWLDNVTDNSREY